MDTPRDPAHITIQDIAEKVRLSRAAVSLALRNSSEVSRETCERVQRVAREMGYRPNPMGTGLAQFKRTSHVRPVQAAVAWINAWPDPNKLRSFLEFDRYWRGASAAAEKAGYHLEEFVVSRQMPMRRLEQMLIARGIQGILLPPFYDYPSLDGWSEFGWKNFSIVRLGRGTAPDVHFVTSAQAANTMTAFDKIREKGYDRVGFAGIPHRARMFAAGFLLAQQELPARLRLPPFFFRDPKTDQRQFEAWLSKSKPDAILAELPFVPDVLQQAGYRVPDDVGLATTSTLDTPIDAGIYQNPEEIGRVAMLVLISLLNDNDRGIPPVHREILVKGLWTDGKTLPLRR